MGKTYTQIIEEIESLKKEAEAVRQKEIEGVVARIREAISFYGLTEEDLGFQRRAGGRRQSKTSAGTRGRKSSERPMSSASASQPKYRDEHGNSWSGRGPRPKWFKEALASGRTPDEFSARPS